MNNDITKERLLYFAKLSSIAVFSFLKINLLGLVSSVLLFAIEFYLLTKDVNVGHSAHVSAVPFLIAMFAARPIGCIILLASCFLGPVLFFMMGNKYLFSKIAHKILVDKSDTYVKPFLDKIITKLKLDKPSLAMKGTDYAIVKLSLAQQLKEESENKWLKKLIEFGFEKAKIEDINFREDGMNMNEILKIKVVDAIQTIAEPSRQSILRLLMAQWVLMLVVWLLPI